MKLLSILVLLLTVRANATVLAYYGGNTSPGRLADSSPNHRNLTATGVPPNPSTPTPPEGNRWLFQDTVDGNDFLNLPLSVLNAAAGCLEFITRATSSSETLFISTYSDIAPFQYFEIDVAFNSDVVLYYQNDVGGDETLTSTGVYDLDGSNQRTRIEWDATGVRVYHKGSLVASSGNKMNTTPITSSSDKRISGNSGTTGYLDACMFSDSASEAYPPVYSVSSTRSSMAYNRQRNYQGGNLSPGLRQ